MEQYDYAKQTASAEARYVPTDSPEALGAVGAIDHGLAYLGDRIDLLEHKLTPALEAPRTEPSAGQPMVDPPTVLHGQAYRLANLAARLDTLISRVAL